MFPDYMQWLAALQGGGGQSAPGLAGALDGSQPAVAPFMQQFQPAMNMAPGMVGGPPGYDPTASIQGGISVPQAQPPMLATEQNVNKLAMAPIDPTKLAAMMGLTGQGQGQGARPQVGAVSPASGHSGLKMQAVDTAAVKRPGQLGGR